MTTSIFAARAAARRVRKTPTAGAGQHVESFGAVVDPKEGDRFQFLVVFPQSTPRPWKEKREASGAPSCPRQR